jgi:hypothetical protein
MRNEWLHVRHGMVLPAFGNLQIIMGRKEILTSDLVPCVAAELIVSPRRLLGRHSK